MKMIFALGNPEQRYESTRHNIGFYILNTYAANKKSDWTRVKSKSLVAKYIDGSETVFLIKPNTYYNNVGESLREMLDFYKIAPQDTLIIHDDLAISFGAIRTRRGGSGGGNNGIKSINLHGGADTARLRIGIANEKTGSQPDADFVLSNFSREERKQLEILTPKIISLIESFIKNEFLDTTLRLADTTADSP